MLLVVELGLGLVGGIVREVGWTVRLRTGAGWSCGRRMMDGVEGVVQCPRERKAGSPLGGFIVWRHS